MSHSVPCKWNTYQYFTNNGTLEQDFSPKHTQFNPWFKKCSTADENQCEFPFVVIQAEAVHKHGQVPNVICGRGERSATTVDEQVHFIQYHNSLQPVCLQLFACQLSELGRNVSNEVQWHRTGIGVEVSVAPTHQRRLPPASCLPTLAAKGELARWIKWPKCWFVNGVSCVCRLSVTVAMAQSPFRAQNRRLAKEKVATIKLISNVMFALLVPLTPFTRCCSVRIWTLWSFALGCCSVWKAFTWHKHQKSSYQFLLSNSIILKAHSD